MDAPLEKVPPNRLARLLDPENLPAFSSADSDAIFLHQLNTPLLPDLATAPGSEPARLHALLTNRPATDSFLQQLTTPHPSLELLQAIKNFARHAQSTPTHPLHGNPANLLYYAAIAAAILRLNTRITQLTDPQLHEALLWSLNHPAAQPLRHILSGAAEIIAPSAE